MTDAKQKSAPDSASSIPQIDVGAVIAKESPKAAKWTPGFVVNGLARLIHQREMNDFMRRYHDLSGVPFLIKVIEEFELNIQYSGLENLDTAGGRYIFAGNHPLGGLDGLALLYTLVKDFPATKFLVNDLLLNLKNLAPLFLGVNRNGKHARQDVAKLEEAYAGDGPICVFPAGMVSRKIQGTVQDLTWQSHFIKKATQYERPIVPVHVSGQNSWFFYCLANLRKRFKIKGNLEMLLLPHEMFRQRQNTLTLTFGQPIPASTFDDSRTPSQWTQWVRDKVYALGTQPATETRRAQTPSVEIAV